MTIAKSFEWDMGHRVTNHDSLCKNPHGHRYKMTVYITGPVSQSEGSSQQGMVMDFGKVKEIVNQQVMATLDHSFMYWERDKVMSAFATTNPELRMNSVPFVPTAECIAEHLAHQIEGLLQSNLPEAHLTKLVIFETPTSQAIWERAS